VLLTWKSAIISYHEPAKIQSTSPLVLDFNINLLESVTGYFQWSTFKRLAHHNFVSISNSNCAPGDTKWTM
jgi:hypothetical protein